MTAGGPDTRTLSATSTSPFQAIGAITALDPFDSGLIGATGFLIDATHVLTSGHVIYDAPQLNFFHSFSFTAGEQGSFQPFGTAHVIAARTTFAFVEGGGFQIDESGDYGLLTLDRPVGNQAGWLALQPITPPADGTPNGSLTNLPVQTAGYAADLDPTLTHQYQTSGSVTTLSFDVGTDLDANHGQSGSPIWTNGSNGPAVIAVLHGVPTNQNLVQTGPSNLQFPIIGAPITVKTMADIQRWEALDAGTYAHTPNGAYVQGIDVQFYLQQNADVAAANIDPVQHYLEFGWKEGRLANPLFDEAWYIGLYTDVNVNHIDPLLHYETFGWKEGRDPSPDFSTSDYLAKNPDVKAAGMNPLDHYLLYGLAEHRSI
jgi:V8-like Glu-specific endopeptidase